MRRVVTGFDASGNSVFIHDGSAPEVMSGQGFELGALWASLPGVILSAQESDAALGRTQTVPAPGGTVFTYVVFPPDSGAAGEVDTHAAPSDFHVEDDGRMHRTDTIDYGVLLQGELWLELDHGARRKLMPGDCFVQNGTRHAWHNPGPGPAIICVAMIGAPRGA